MTEPIIYSEAEENAAKHREYALISQVAHMYYDQDMLQPEISEKLHFSRSKVSRMLSQARKLGIVEIRVRQIVDRTTPLEKKLCETFGLKEAVVISCFENQSRQEAFQSLTDFAALYLSSLLKGKCRIGLSNGKTADAVVEKLHKQNPCSLEVVQLIGATSNTFLAGESRRLVDEMLSKFSGTGFFLNTPLYVDDVFAKEVLMKDPTVQEVFEHMRGCDLLLTGIGALLNQERGVQLWYGYQTQRHLDELRAKGAVGSLCAQYYDCDGRLVDCEWNRKCLAMPLEDVRSSKRTVGVACGAEKAAAILGALRGGLLNVLVTDAATATQILQLQEKMER